ncbi:hypothetical protein TNCV_2494631 [Trichonephila clavipes]|uniref:Uncharacterized protein n=1 Tax=Trichonephila clavipes TaxID=2585209 RepID=A0A8X6S2C8_TRICX|nr:hypothetical protein TNCV_2494631 [Trichonephila clavipes]
MDVYGYGDNLMNPWALHANKGLFKLVRALGWSSCAVEQFHSDASLEAVDQRALNNSRNWQWTTEGDVSVQ